MFLGQARSPRSSCWLLAHFVLRLVGRSLTSFFVSLVTHLFLRLVGHLSRSSSRWTLACFVLRLIGRPLVLFFAGLVGHSLSSFFVSLVIRSLSSSSRWSLTCLVLRLVGCLLSSVDKSFVVDKSLGKSLVLSVINFLTPSQMSLLLNVRSLPNNYEYSHSHGPRARINLLESTCEPRASVLSLPRLAIVCRVRASVKLHQMRTVPL